MYTGACANKRHEDTKVNYRLIIRAYFKAIFSMGLFYLPFKSANPNNNPNTIVASEISSIDLKCFSMTFVPIKPNNQADIMERKTHQANLASDVNPQLQAIAAKLKP
jgi:hypothetical protein